MNREFFNKPIRKDTTLEFYPDKLTLEEFEFELREHIEPFIENMKSLKNGADQPKYIEQWYQIWLVWNEVETEKNV